ncbi:MAG: SGNH/GDSL hydrolase family protein, partial [Acidimicrobiales bacterium]
RRPCLLAASPPRPGPLPHAGPYGEPVSQRPSRWGWVARALVPGVRRVHGQVVRYARLWDEANTAAVAGAGPLWVVLGDSTAQGIGAPSHDQGYVGQLRARLDGEWRVLNWSRSGARTAGVIGTQLPRLDALDVEPALITVAIGANDLYPTPLDVLVANLRTIMGQLPPDAVIATLPQGLKPQKAGMANDVIRAEAPARGLRVADVWARTGPPWRGKYASDAFHPNHAGYADWTAAFAEALGL